jgi:hypothetical protein
MNFVRSSSCSRASRRRSNILMSQCILLLAIMWRKFERDPCIARLIGRCIFSVTNLTKRYSCCSQSNRERAAKKSLDLYVVCSFSVAQKVEPAYLNKTNVYNVLLQLFSFEEVALKSRCLVFTVTS